jgi:hypothetical protein
MTHLGTVVGVEMYGALKAEAAKQDKTMNQCVREAVEAWLVKTRKEETDGH